MFFVTLLESLNSGPPYFANELENISIQVGERKRVTLPDVIEPDEEAYSIEVKPMGGK